jgi:membrane protein implicated in regulation of membrane protease activity
VSAADRRPRIVANTLTFAWRALLKIKHTPEQMFDVVVTPIMFTVMFTYLFGGALKGSTDEYLQFLLPGILVQTVVFTSVYTGFMLNTDMSKGIFDRFRSLPIWRPAPIVGAMAGDTVRYTVSAIIVFVVGLIMGFRPGTGLPGVIASIVLASQSFVMPVNEYQIRQMQRSQHGILAPAAGVTLLGFLLRHWLPATPILRNVVLEPPDDADVDDPLDELVGRFGTTTTRLAPAGKARIGDAVRDVASDGPLIEPGTAVRVVDVRGGRVIVHPAEGA